MLRQVIESLQASVEEQGASSAELWTTYEGLAAEHAECVKVEEECWSAWQAASRRRHESWDAVAAAHAAYEAAAGSGR